MGQQENKQRTRRDLSDAAMGLFAAKGYENVTMEEVAMTAGVSRRTAFRYFPMKADLVLEYPNEWRRVFDAVVVEHRALPLPQRLRLAVIAVGEHIEKDAQPVRLLFSLAFEHPSIAGRYAVNSQDWTERIYDELVQGHTPVANETEARMVASALMGIIDAACGIWATGDEDLRDLLNQGMDIAENCFETLKILR